MSWNSSPSLMYSSRLVIFRSAIKIVFPVWLLLVTYMFLINNCKQRFHNAVAVGLCRTDVVRAFFRDIEQAFSALHLLLLDSARRAFKPCVLIG